MPPPHPPLPTAERAQDNPRPFTIPNLAERLPEIPLHTLTEHENQDLLWLPLR